MSPFNLSEDTLKDLLVNIIPLGIIVFFMVTFLVFQPFGGGSLRTTLMSQMLLVVPLVTLGALTYVSGRLIQSEEQRDSEHEAEVREGPEPATQVEGEQSA
ncbi:DUF6684 family protein [Haloferax namakaokahaiae]|uniref:DUF6684 family protein n=1 Tax=Haloferax namakaokahaiae TaxID=1748331 RepID=A0ABD5ZD46_9EURY